MWTPKDGNARIRSHAKSTPIVLVTVETDKLRGVYIDPNTGRVTFRDFGKEWLDGRTSDESTREAVKSRLAVHVYHEFGDRELAAIRPSHIQAWLRGLQERLAPRYVRVILANVSAVFAAAVDDERIVKIVASSLIFTPPKGGKVRDVPMSQAVAFQLAAHIDAHPHGEVTLPWQTRQGVSTSAAYYS
jgi:Phage integrase, N-terminal SAM-like domain